MLIPISNREIIFHIYSKIASVRDGIITVHDTAQNHIIEARIYCETP